MKFRYTRHGAIEAYNQKNFKALALFNEADNGKYAQFWIETPLLYAFHNKNTQEIEKFLDILITKETSPKKMIFSASIGMTLAATYRNHEFVTRFFNVGINPRIKRTTNDRRNRYMHIGDQDLFFITALDNYHKYAREMLEGGYELNEQTGQKLLQYLFSVRLLVLLNP